MIDLSFLEGQKIGVLGLGRSGRATALALMAAGAEVLAWDDDPSARAAAEVADIPVQDLARPKALEEMERLIVSPGIPHLYPAPHTAIEAALRAGLLVDNDIGLFFAAYREAALSMDQPPKVIAVTGSNGKSTTTALIAHILRHAGRAVQIGGNFGTGVLSLDLEESEGPRAAIVLELSSYQLELAQALAPDVAVFLNLSPDHLSRHGGMGGYFAAKARLFDQGWPATSIVGVNELEGAYLANRLHHTQNGKLIRLTSGARAHNGHEINMRKGFLSEWSKGRQVASFDLRQIASLPGAHNHQNACAAYAACREFNLPPRLIFEALESYPGLAHRAQIVAVRGGVTYVNDSKATNADAAEKSLTAFRNIHWIAGGVAKEGGIAPLLPHLGHVKAAYLIGAAATDFAQTLEGHLPAQLCGDLEAALRAAEAAAEAGDVILLAPACASFDQFKSFEHRGEAFAALVCG